jgi:drug/metabolite transporter (DMT)-like permease
VPAAQAHVLFSSLPLWSALFAALLLLQGEHIGAFGWAGGLLITCARVIASRR